MPLRTSLAPWRSIPRIAERGIVGKALGESGSVEVGAGISYRYSDLSCHGGGVLRRSQCDSLVRCNIATPTMINPSAISFVVVNDSWKNHIPIIATSAVPIPDHTA